MEFPAKGSQAEIRVVGSNVGERVAAIVIGDPLLGTAIGSSRMVGRTRLINVLFKARAALYQV